MSQKGDWSGSCMEPLKGHRRKKNLSKNFFFSWDNFYCEIKPASVFLRILETYGVCSSTNARNSLTGVAFEFEKLSFMFHRKDTSISGENELWKKIKLTAQMGGKNKGFVLTRPPASCFVRVFVYSQKENGTIWDVENLFFFILFALRVKFCRSERSWALRSSSTGPLPDDDSKHG